MSRMHNKKEINNSKKKEGEKEKKVKLEYIGLITSGVKYQLLQTTMQGEIQGKRSIDVWMQ